MKKNAEKIAWKIVPLCLLTLSACQTVQNPALPNLTTTEKMAWSTYVIATQKGLGTCVIVNRKDASAPGGIAPVLVTCAHVLAAAPHGPYFLMLRMPVEGANPANAVLGIDSPPGHQPPYVQHPRRDVAAMEIHLPPDIARLVSIPSFINENTLAHQSSPHVGDEILLLGFPKVFPGTEGGFPVFRGGRIASYSCGSQEDLEQYLVNANVYSGDSGGPVFAASKHGAPQLLGLACQRIGPKSGAVPLGIAIDTRVIRETLALLPRHPLQGTSETESFGRQFATRTESAPPVRLIGSRDLLDQVLNAKSRAVTPIKPGRSEH